MRIGWLSRAISFGVARYQHFRNLPKSLRTAGSTCLVANIRVIPFVQLQDLLHLGWDIDAEFFDGREDVTTFQSRHISAQLEDLHPRRCAQVDSKVFVIIQ